MKQLNKISKAFFINLDRRTDRLAHINKNLPFSAERFPAIDAKKLGLNEEIEKIFNKCLNKLTKAEIACSLSHYNLWKRLTLDKSSDNYLILEDDVVFKEGFTNFWNQVFSKHIPENYNLIYLGGCQPWNKPQYPKVLERYNDFFCNVKKNDFFTKDDHYFHMNAQSYIISKNGAKLICDYIDTYGFDLEKNQAQDIFMINFFNKNKLFEAPKSIYHLNPPMSYQLHEENDNTEIDKNSDLRHAKEKFIKVENMRDKPIQKKEKKIINLHYWQGPQSGVSNFGDELSTFVVKKLLPFNDFHFNQNPENYEKNLIGIGSYMHKARDGFYIFGSGVRKLTHSCYCQDLNIISTRGPATQGVLQSKNIDCPRFFGDPALFVSRYYQPKKDKSLEHKIGFVPHIFDNEDYSMDENFHIIKPTLPWSQVIDQICSCKAILSSSLHGLICADAYSVPNAWLKCKTLEDGEFKFKDYFLSQGRDFKFLSTIEDLNSDVFYRGGNKINLDKLSERLYKSKLLEPRQNIAIVYRIPKKHKEKYLNWRDGFTEACKLLSSVYNVDFYNIEDGVPDLAVYDWVFVKEGFDGNIFKSIKNKIQGSRVGIFISSSGSIPSQRQLDEFDIIFYETDWYFDYANLSRHQNAYKAFGVDQSLIKKNKITKKDIDYLFVGSIVGYKRPWEILKYKGVKVCVGEIVDHEIKSFLEKNGVLVLSFVDYASLMNLYARSKNCIVPCELHGGGERSVLESRACGVSVLVMQDNPKLQELIRGEIYDQHDYAVSIYSGMKMLEDSLSVVKINPAAVRHNDIEYVLYRTELYPQDCPAYYRASSGKKINFYRSNAGYKLKISGSKTIDCTFDFGDYSYVKSKMIDLAGTTKMKIEDIRFIENTIESNDGGVFCLACCTILSNISVFEGQKKDDGSWDEKKPIGLKLKTSPGICRVNLNTGKIQYIRTLTNQSDDIQKNWLMFKHEDLYYCLYSMFPLIYRCAKSIDDIQFSDQEKAVRPKLHSATCPIKIDQNRYAMICHSERFEANGLPWAYKKYLVTFDVIDQKICNVFSKELDINKEYYCSSIIKDGDQLKVFAGVEDINNVGFYIDVPWLNDKSFPRLSLINHKQIPKKIHLSWKNKNVLNSNYSLIKKGAKNLELLNPGWDIEVNDDEDVNRYIRDNIGKSSWGLIKDRKITEKTDLWRLLKIYKEGGLYVDIDRYIDTPLSDIIKSNTSCVIPTFQDIDFSQDFVLSCANNPMIERAISNNLFNRKNGQNLFYTAVCSYMHAASEFLSGQQVDRGDNPVYFNDIRKQIEACEYLETFREIGPEYHTLYRNVDGNFNIQTFEKDKADFYNGESVIHWNADTQAKHTQLKNTNKQKLVFLQHNLFEEDFLLELFSDVEIIYDLEMNGVYENACVVYSNIYHRDSNVYKNESFRKTLNQQKQKLSNFLNQQKNCYLVHLSDEHCHANIDHYKNFTHVFRQYHRSDAVADNVTFIPLGYKKGFNNE